MWSLYIVINSRGTVIGRVTGQSECDAYWAAVAQYGSTAVAEVSISA